MRLATLILSLLLPLQVAATEQVRVAVAANFRATLEQLNTRFEAETGHHVVLSSASTGTLYNQIIHGAPVDVFFAANVEAPARLALEGRGESFCYSLGRLVLVGGNGELSQLGDPTLSLAIANPQTAPYGAAATEILARSEFSSGTDRKLIRGNNVTQAYQFWHSGGTDLALVARSIAPEGTPIATEWHQPIEQHAVLLSRGAGKASVQAYMKWIRSDRVRSNILEAGYDPCP